MKKIVSFLLLLAVLVGSYRWYVSGLAPADAHNDVRIIVPVATGTSFGSVTQKLYDLKIIRSPLAFSLYARFHGLRERVQAGTFVLRPSMDAAEVLTTLTGAKSKEITVTIPEGYTVKDIDALLAEKGITKPGDIVLCAQTCDFSAYSFLPKDVKGLAPRGGRLDGYLFPDTYFVTDNQFDAKAFLSRLLSTFDTRVVQGLSSDLAASKHTLHEIVTMASLVEEETRAADERPVVAGMLWKRLDAKMPLGVDAAVRYEVDKPRTALTEKDLQTDSPYNLRRFRGLPPGPIANPSLSSIEAALHPKDSPYWYYLHDANGVIHYATTNDEHNRNRALYLSQ